MSKSRSRKSQSAEPIVEGESSTSVGERIDRIVTEFAEKRQSSEAALFDLNAQMTQIMEQVDQHTSILRAMESEQAAAIKQAMGQFHVVLDPTPARRVKQAVKRLTGDDLRKVAEAVLAKLTNEPKNKSQLATETGLDIKAVDRGLWKLAREGKAETNGVRGKNSGWMKK